VHNLPKIERRGFGLNLATPTPGQPKRESFRGEEREFMEFGRMERFSLMTPERGLGPLNLPPKSGKREGGTC